MLSPGRCLHSRCFTHRPGRKQMFPSAQIFTEISLVKGMFTVVVTEGRDLAEGARAQ